MLSALLLRRQENLLIHMAIPCGICYDVLKLLYPMIQFYLCVLQDVADSNMVA